MKYIFRFFSILILWACLLNLSACGKLSDPAPMEGSGYPHSYPRR